MTFKPWMYALPISGVCCWLCPYTVWSLGKISAVVIEGNHIQVCCFVQSLISPQCFPSLWYSEAPQPGSCKAKHLHKLRGWHCNSKAESDQACRTFLSLLCWLLSLLFLGSYLSCLAFKDSISFWFVWTSKEMEIKVISCWIVCPLPFIRGVSSHLHEGCITWSQK